MIDGIHQCLFYFFLLVNAHNSSHNTQRISLQVTFVDGGKALRPIEVVTMGNPHPVLQVQVVHATSHQVLHTLPDHFSIGRVHQFINLFDRRVRRNGYAVVLVTVITFKHHRMRGNVQTPDCKFHSLQDEVVLHGMVLQLSKPRHIAFQRTGMTILNPQQHEGRKKHGNPDNPYQNVESYRRYQRGKYSRNS